MKLVMAGLSTVNGMDDEPEKYKLGAMTKYWKIFAMLDFDFIL